MGTCKRGEARRTAWSLARSTPMIDHTNPEQALREQKPNNSLPTCHGVESTAAPVTPKDRANPRWSGRRNMPLTEFVAGSSREVSPAERPQTQIVMLKKRRRKRPVRTGVAGEGRRCVAHGRPGSADEGVEGVYAFGPTGYVILCRLTGASSGMAPGRGLWLELLTIDGANSAWRASLVVSGNIPSIWLRRTGLVLGLCLRKAARWKMSV